MKHPLRLAALAAGLLATLPLVNAHAADRRLPPGPPQAATATLRTAGGVPRVSPLPFVDVTESGPAPAAAAAAPPASLDALAPPHHVATAITSIASGNWNATTTWSSGTVPTSGDDVTIANGHTVTINAGSACASLVVSGVLTYEATTARALNVGGNVTVNAGGTLQSAATGTQTGHLLFVGGSLTNNGTLDLSTNANTAGAGITFTGAANATFGGTGGTTDIRVMTVNKGSSAASVLELAPTNFTVRGATVNATGTNGMLALASGTFKLGGTFFGANTLGTAASWTIPAAARLWLVNPNYTIAAQNGTITVSGALTMDAGTLNVGNSSGNRLAYTAGAAITVNGGTINVAGRLSPTSNPVTYTQSGGTVNLTTVDNASTTNTGFDLQSGSTFTMSGGTIALQKAASATVGPRDYRNLASTVSITGGTLQVGNASTPASPQTFVLQGVTPSITITNATANHVAQLAGELDVLGNTTLQAGTKLTLNGTFLVQAGPTLTNDGTIDGGLAGSHLYFFGNAAQTYDGAGTTGTMGSPLATLDLDNGSTVTLGALPLALIATRANLFRGTLVHSDRLQLGVGGASSAVTQIGATANPSAGGSYDVAPTFDVGTGGYSLLYEGEAAARTTGVEIPASRAVAFVEINNTHDVALAGGDLAIAGTLQFPAASKNLTTGANTVAVGAGGSVVRSNAATSGYVAGNLAKNVPLGNSTRAFEIGDAGAYAPVAVDLAGVSVAGTLTGRTDAGDLAIPAGSEIDPARGVNRNWTLGASPGFALTSATGTFNFVPGDIDGGATAANFVVRKLDGGAWSGTTPGTRTATSTQATWSSGFSRFAIGELNSYAVNVTTVGSGTVTRNPDQAAYAFGSSVELTSTPQAGWHFVGWSGDAAGATNPLTVLVDGAKNLTATFALNTYAVDVATVGNGTVAKNPDQATYAYGSSVELTATAAPDWHFVGWSGDASGSTNPLTVLVDAERNLTATFAIDTHAVNVTTVGSGAVARNPDQPAYDVGSSVELTATPATGWHFVGWSGDATGAANPTTVLVDAEKNVQATFAADTFAVHVTTVGNGTVVRNPDQAFYDYGSSVELTATAAPGWHFAGWSGDATGAPNPLTVLVDGEKNLTATFAINTFAVNVTTVGSGTVTKAPDQAEYDEGSSVELTATAASHWHFVGWSGDASGPTNPLTVFVDGEKTITATFAADTFAVNVATVGSGTVVRNPAQSSYGYGSSVELTATPATGWHFVEWSGDASGSANPLTVLVDGEKNLTATFALDSYAVSVTTVGSGTVARNPDQASYEYGSSVELTATAAPDWHFVGWSGDASGSTNPLTVLVDAEKHITATFAIDTYPVHVATVGSGAVARNPDQAAYDLGSSVELTATPATGWHFVEWSGDASGSTNPLTVLVDGEKNLTATFAIDSFTVQVTTVGNGSVTRDPDQASYEYGSSVTLTATAEPGWHFVGWNGDASGSANPLTVLVDAPKNIIARFAINQFAVNVTTVGSGTVTKNPDQASYFEGSSVELTATAATGWHFVGWSGDATGSTNPLTVLVDAEKNLTATFAADTFAVNVSTVGNGTVVRNPDQAAYDYGTSVQLTANAAAGWHFVGWSGDATGSTNPLTVLVDAEKNLTATFALNTFALDVTIVGNGTVVKDPDQASYLGGSAVALTATADPDWQFAGWSGDASGSTNPLTVTMDSDKNVTATFTEAIAPTAHLDAPNTSAETMFIGQEQLIQWTAADNVAVSSVDLYLSRNGAAGPFDPIALGLANTGSYAWTVTGPATADGVLRVVAHDAALNQGEDDSDEPLQIIEPSVAVDPAVLEFALLPVVPSPSVSSARVRFDLPRDARVDLGIADVRGREVAALVHGAVPAGRHVVSWNGQTAAGHAPAGVYFAYFRAGGMSFVRRIVLLR